MLDVSRHQTSTNNLTMTSIKLPHLVVSALLLVLHAQFISAEPTSAKLLATYSPTNIADAHEIWHVSTRGLSQYDQLERDLNKIEYLQFTNYSNRLF